MTAPELSDEQCYGIILSVFKEWTANNTLAPHEAPTAINCALIRAGYRAAPRDGEPIACLQRGDELDTAIDAARALTAQQGEKE